MPTMPRWSVETMGVVVLAAVGIGALRVAAAQEWREPTAIPPAGNPPGFVWTQSPNDTPQSAGQFNVSGGGKIGGAFQALGMSTFGDAMLDLGVASGGQNLIYGVAHRERMHANDALLLLQSTALNPDPNFPEDIPQDRFRVDRDGRVVAAASLTAPTLCIGNDCKNAWPTGAITEVRAGTNLAGGGAEGAVTLRIADTVTIEQDITAKRCFGPVFVGVSTSTRAGVGGYDNANAHCGARQVGSHLCTTEDVLRSITCGAFARAGTADGTRFWIAAGPPGYSAPVNDCRGWTSSDPAQLGSIWEYDANGGKGFISSCDVSYPMGCCK